MSLPAHRSIQSHIGFSLQWNHIRSVADFVTFTKAHSFGLEPEWDLLFSHMPKQSQEKITPGSKQEQSERNPKVA